MPERLTVQLGDGSVEKLRELAGGERKVGAFLTDVVSWLHLYKDVLQTRPIAEFLLWHKNFGDDVSLNGLRVYIQEVDANLTEKERRLAELKNTVEASLKRMETLGAAIEVRLADMNSALRQQEERQQETDDQPHADADNEDERVRPA